MEASDHLQGLTILAPRPRYPVNTGLDGPHGRSGRSGKENITFYPCREENNDSSVYSKTNQMHQCIKFILFWNDTLHVSDGLSVHHQEFKTVHTASIQQYLFDKMPVAVCTVLNS